MEIFERLESEVRSYCRTWPTVFDRAAGCWLYDEQGNAYLDFFSGAGALNYGHNNPKLKRKLLEYLEHDGVVHGLDQYTTAKRTFIERFNQVILEPRGLSYKLMFPGPTGTNAVEAALKVARKYTGRETVIGFTNAFHGMTLGSLAVTGDAMKRQGAHVSLPYAAHMPFCDYFGPEIDTLQFLDTCLEDNGSGTGVPAAIILETVQGEGGLASATDDWLQRLEELCRRRDILLIVDDIQAGCGRTGTFFSFERAGITPDIVTLSKSLSGYGLPMSVTLLRPEVDVWKPGEHNGTFRGNNAAFVTATAALSYWEDDWFSRQIQAKADAVRVKLETFAEQFATQGFKPLGRGLMQGLECQQTELAEHIIDAAFDRGLLCETSGADDQVVKLMPPLTIDWDELSQGLDILERAIQAGVGEHRAAQPQLTQPLGS